LSFVHAVRVIKCKLPQATAIPPERLPAWYQALLVEIGRGRRVSSRGKLNPRGVKRKMSGYYPRRRGQPLNRTHNPIPIVI